MNFPNLQEFICSHNKLTLLPLCILNWKNIIRILYYNNPIKFSTQIVQFLNHIKNSSLNNLNIHRDPQNIHNLIIQSSLRDSINNITEITDLLNYDDTLHKLIINDNK